MGLTVKLNIDTIKDNDVREHVKELQEQATGRVIELSAAPTASVPLLEDNERGTFENIFYRRVASTILVFTPSSTISVT